MPARCVSPARKVRTANGIVNESTAAARTNAEATGTRAQTKPPDKSTSNIADNRRIPLHAVANVISRTRTQTTFARGSRRCRALDPRLHSSNTTWRNSDAPAAGHQTAEHETNDVD